MSEPITQVLVPISRDQLEKLTQLSERVSPEHCRFLASLIRDITEEFESVERCLPQIEQACLAYKTDDDIDVDREPVRVAETQEGYTWVSAYVAVYDPEENEEEVLPDAESSVRA